MMIKVKAQDLRLGNLVQRPEGIRIPELDGEAIYFGVNFVMLRDCLQYGKDWAFEGVPLTEEWMRRFGFERKIENTGAPINEDVESYVLDGYEFSEDCDGAWFLCGQLEHKAF